jgi:hypothetical protein
MSNSTRTTPPPAPVRESIVLTLTPAEFARVKRALDFFERSLELVADHQLLGMRSVDLEQKSASDLVKRLRAMPF